VNCGRHDGAASIVRDIANQKEISMSTHINKSPPPLMWIAGIAIILFSVVGIAAVMGWIPSSLGNSSDQAVPSSPVAAVTSSPVVVKAHSEPMHITSRSHAKATCVECGVIQSTREIVERGNGCAVGIVGGAVVGGLLGNQVGGGHGKDIATVAGAVGGAIAGNEIQKRVDTAKRYETVVRFDDGSSRTFTSTDATDWREGDHVKVVDGVIRWNN
jgi:outer membrane lipoprotein SlyB